MPQYTELGIAGLPDAGDLTGSEFVAVGRGRGTFKTTTTALGALNNKIAVGIVAGEGGQQSSATQLDYGYSAIAAGFSANDSVALPDAVAGAVCTLFATGAGLTNAAYVAVYAKYGTTDTINGQSNATQFDMAGGESTGSQPFAGIFVCVEDGAWVTNCTVD